MILLYALPFTLDALPRPATVARNDLEYYANWTDGNGPAMTCDQWRDSFYSHCSFYSSYSFYSHCSFRSCRGRWSAFSMAWLFALGDEAKAATLFARGYQSYVRPPYGVWDETPSGGCGNFITGAGGFLQSVIYGYGGLRYGSESLTITPRLPPDAGSLTIDGIKYRGASLRLDVADTAATLTLVRAAIGGEALVVSGRPLEVGTPIPLALGEAVDVVSHNPAIPMSEPSEPLPESASSKWLSFLSRFTLWRGWSHRR